MIYVTDDKNLIKSIDEINKKTDKKEEKWEEENDSKFDCFTFCDVRRLGRVWLSKDIMKEEPLSNHGFDIMDEVPPFEDYLKSMKTKTCGIKSLLLDQSFSSGIGNWIADEILYQARVHPLQNVDDLDDDDIKRIYDAMIKIVEISTSVNADADQFPKDWIFHYRWSKRSSGKGSSVSIPGVGKVEFLKAGGRTSAIVPTLQKLRKGNKRKSSNNIKKEVKEEKETLKGKGKRIRKVESEIEIEEEKIEKETKPKKMSKSSRCKKVKVEKEEENKVVKKEPKNNTRSRTPSNHSYGLRSRK